MTDPAVPDSAVVALLAPGAGRGDLALARELNLPVTDRPDPRFALLLTREKGALRIRWSAPGGPGPVHVDFAGGFPGRRLRSTTAGQPLSRAVGLSGGIRRVLDATAGLGADTASLAFLGCRVLAVERHPVVAALLQDGLRRALQTPELAVWAARISLQVGDARQVMQRLPLEQRPETVLLDPMFLEKGPAQVKKYSQLLRALVGGETGSDLIDAALGCASRRVVVKRHLHAQPLGAPPDLVVSGTRVRYDVYLIP